MYELTKEEADELYDFLGNTGKHGGRRKKPFVFTENDIRSKFDKLEDGTNRLFKVVFQRLDEIDEKIAPKLSPNPRC